jgi:hypothetical protein
MDVFKKGTPTHQLWPVCDRHQVLVTVSALQVGPEEKLWRNATGQMAKGIQCGTELPKEVNSKSQIEQVPNPRE